MKELKLCSLKNNNLHLQGALNIVTDRGEEAANNAVTVLLDLCRVVFADEKNQNNRPQGRWKIQVFPKQNQTEQDMLMYTLKDKNKQHYRNVSGGRDMPVGEDREDAWCRNASKSTVPCPRAGAVVRETPRRRGARASTRFPAQVGVPARAS